MPRSRPGWARRTWASSLPRAPGRSDRRRARDIVKAAGGVPVVGVFVSHSVDEILRLRDAAGLSAAQLHGAYDAAEYGGACGGRRCQCGWCMHIAGPEDLELLAEQVAEGGRRAHDRAARPGCGGGNRRRTRPRRWPRRRARVLARSRLALAGGLRPDTLARAIALVSPDIVDVSSGVESAPGLKDADRLARFLEVARDA